MTPAGQPASTPAARVPVWQVVGAVLLVRLLVDTSIQIFFPFLPIIAAGLGISVVQLGQINSLRTLMGLSAPLFGMLADRRGIRPTLRLGVLAIVAGLALFGSSPSLAVATVAMVIIGLGLSALLPNLFAYTSASLPYAQRSRGMGAIELSWALAGIIGLSLAGILIDATSWRVPFWVGAGLLLAASLLLARLPDLPHAASVAAAGRQRLGDLFDLGPKAGSVWAIIAATSITAFAANHLFSAYGEWLFREYALGATQLGRVALLLGSAALCSNIIISLFGDRIGRVRSLRLSAIGALLSFAALPALDFALTPLLAGYFVAYLFFEFTIVNGIILCTEQLAAHRARVMALQAAVTTLALSLANLTGPLAYDRLGVWGLVIPSVAAWSIVALLVWRRVQAGDEAGATAA